MNILLFSFAFSGEFLCKLVNFSPVFIITSSIYTLVGVSFERHRAILGSHGRQVTFRVLFILIPVIWLFSLLVSIPTLIEYSVNTITVIRGNETKTQLSCGSQQQSRSFSLVNAAFVIVISYILPVFMLFRNYIQVAVYVWRKGRKIRNKPGPSGHNLTSLLRFKSTIQLVKLLVAVAVIFAVSWLPFFIILLYAVGWTIFFIIRLLRFGPTNVKIYQSQVNCILYNWATRCLVLWVSD